MATLDEIDSQTMSKLLAKLGIEGEVSSLDDLKALIKPKTKSEIKKDFLMVDMLRMRKMTQRQKLLLFQNFHGFVVQHQFQNDMCHLPLGNMKLKD